MNKVVRERLPQLDLFRAFAIFCVIQVHASSFAAGGQALHSPIYYFYNWLNIFFKIGTTSFIFLSGFVLFYNYYDQPVTRNLLGRFYKKRLTNIILPYILISCSYFVIVAVQNRDLFVNSKLYELKLLGLALLKGTAYTHLYYVFISMQFYIIFPLLLWLFQSFRKKRMMLAFIFPLGIAVQWGFYFWNKYGLHLPNKGSYVLSYMAFYMLGAAAAIYYDHIKTWLLAGYKEMSKLHKTFTVILWVGWLAISFYHVQLWYSYNKGLGAPSSVVFELVWNIQTLLSAIVILRAAFVIYQKGSAIWKKPLIRLGELSFGIYLVHPIVLLYYRLLRTERNLPGDSIAYLIYIIGGSLCALFLSWVFVQFCFRKLPFASILLGNVPPSLSKNKSPGIQDHGQKSSTRANM